MNLQKLQTDLETAESRVALLNQHSEQVETRNKQLISSAKEEAEKIRSDALAENAKLKSELEADITRLGTIKEGLITEITSLNESISTNKEVSEQLETKVLEKKQTLDAKDEDFGILQVNIRAAKATLADLTSQQQDEKARINDLQATKTLLMQEKQVLQDEVDDIENKVIEADAAFKATDDDLKAKLSNVQQKLKLALDSLQEAQNKDQKIRESWAEGQLKLDKRETVVRRMESRLGSLEARYTEMEKFSKL